MVRIYDTGQARVRAAQAQYGTIFAIAWDIDPTRDARGRFTTFQRELIPLNRALSVELQEQVAGYIEGNIKRPAVSTGRLVDATINPKNRVDDYSNISRWAVLVGRPQWLDESPAKYWRTIEEGSAEVYRGGRGMVGLEIGPGKWGESIVGMYANAWGAQPLAGPPWTKFGVNREGKLRPFSKKIARAKGLRPNTVKREIAPMNAYGTVWTTGRWPRRFDEAWRWALDRALFTQRGKPTGGLKNAIAGI